MQPEKPPSAKVDGTMLVASGSFGTFCAAIAALIVGKEWEPWIKFVAPWVTVLVAALWPNFWERFQWQRLRRQSIKQIDDLVRQLKEYRPNVTSEQVRDDLTKGIHKLEAERVRITAARPFMNVNIIYAEVDESTSSEMKRAA